MMTASTDKLDLVLELDEKDLGRLLSVLQEMEIPFKVKTALAYPATRFQLQFPRITRDTYIGDPTPGMGTEVISVEPTWHSVPPTW